MIDQLLQPTPTPNIRDEYTGPEFDWDNFETTRVNYSLVSVVFTRKHLIEFDNLVARSQANEIPVNTVLDYIDPGARVSIDGESYLNTLGYFLDQTIRILENRDGLERETMIFHTRAIHEARMQLIAIAGAPHPYIWSRGNEILVETQLATSAEENRLDPIKMYKQSVSNLMDYIESSYDSDQVASYLLHRYTDTLFHLKHNIGRGDSPLDPRVRANLETTLLYLQNGLERYGVEYSQY